jgi:hypothetical protein
MIDPLWEVALRGVCIVAMMAYRSLLIAAAGRIMGFW